MHKPLRGSKYTRDVDHRHQQRIKKMPSKGILSPQFWRKTAHKTRLNPAATGVKPKTSAVCDQVHNLQRHQTTLET